MTDEVKEPEQEQQEVQETTEQDEQSQGDDVAQAVEALKRKNQELLGELKTEREKRREFETKQQQIERERMEQQGQFKELSERHQTEAEQYKRELSELRASIAAEKVGNKAHELASEYASDARNAKLLARFMKESLDYVDGDVVARDHASIEDMVRQMEQSGDFASLWRGKQSSGGGAAGQKGGGAVTKKFDQMTGAELSVLRKEKPDEYTRLRDEFYNR